MFLRSGTMTEVMNYEKFPEQFPLRARMWNFGLFQAVISKRILCIIEQFDGFKRLIILTQLIFF